MEKIGGLRLRLKEALRRCRSEVRLGGKVGVRVSGMRGVQLAGDGGTRVRGGVQEIQRMHWIMIVLVLSKNKK